MKKKGCFLLKNGSINSGNKGALSCNNVEEIGEVGWGESNIAEIVKMLEYVYENLEEASEVGQIGAERVWGWGEEITRMLYEGGVI